MPRLPGVRDVTRVSTDGLRLLALDAPAPDPTGEALQGFGRSLGQFGEALGEFRKKQQAAEAAAQSSGLQGRVTAARTDFLENDRDDQSDMTGPFEPDRFKRKLLQFDQFTATELDAVRGTSFEAQARQIVQVNRDQFRAKLEIKRFQAKDAEIETVFQNTLSTFGQTVSDDPSMLPVMLETGEDAIRKFGTARGLSEERINRDVAALRSDLSARVLDRGVENGNAPGVLKSLDEKNEITDAIEAPRTRGIRRNAKRQIIREQGAFKVMEARTLDAIVETGEGGTALIERARAVLTDEGEIAGAEARVRVAEAANGFQEDVLFVTPEQMDDALLASFPGDFAGEEDQETFAAMQDVTVRLLEERESDPAGYVMQDRTIAALFDDENNRAEAIALRIQAQLDMGVAPADVRVLTNQEVQAELANLNPLGGQARAQALLTLKDRYGEHFPAAVNEMLRQGASMGTRTLAEFIDNPAMVQLLGDVVGGTQAEFLNTLFPDGDREERNQFVLQASGKLGPLLADLRAESRLNENVDSITTRRLALKIFAETGDMDQAVRRSVALLNPEAAASIDEERRGRNTVTDNVEDESFREGTSEDALLSSRDGNRSVSNADNVALPQSTEDADKREENRTLPAAENGNDLSAPNLSKTNTDLSPGVVGLLTQREAELRNKGRDLVAELRAKIESNEVRDSKGVRDIEEKIRSVLPFHKDLQDDAITLLRGSQFKREARDREGEEALLNKLAAAVNNPLTLRKMQVSEKFRNDHTDAELDEIFEARVEPRKKRDQTGTILLRFVKSWSNEKQRLAEAIKEREALPNGANKKLSDNLNTKIDRLQKAVSSREKSIQIQALRLSEANRVLAGMLSTPHRDVDKKLALRQEAIETRDERLRRLATDGALLAGGFAATLIRKGIGRAALTGTLTMSEATIAYNRGFNDRMAKVFESTSLDMTNESEVREFVQKNENLIRKTTNQAIVDVLTGLVSKKVAERVGKMLGQNFIEETVTEKALKGEVDAVRSALEKNP